MGPAGLTSKGALVNCTWPFMIASASVICRHWTRNRKEVRALRWIKGCEPQPLLKSGNGLLDGLCVIHSPSGVKKNECKMKTTSMKHNWASRERGKGEPLSAETKRPIQPVSNQLLVIISRNNNIDTSTSFSGVVGRHGYVKASHTTSAKPPPVSTLMHSSS